MRGYEGPVADAPVSPQVRFEALHHQLLASAKVVAYAHEHYPQFQMGDMNVFLTAYPLTCDPEDVLAAQKHNHVINWFCSDVQIRGEYPSYMKRYFKEQGITIGTTTVYRNLEKMVEQGMVAKYNVDGTSSACFEYLGAEEHCHKTSCFHCKCEKCGKLIHLHCEDVVKLEQHLMDSHGFRMDPCRTVFYGICEECRGLEDDKKETETVHIRAK